MHNARDLPCQPPRLRTDRGARALPGGILLLAGLLLPFCAMAAGDLSPAPTALPSATPVPAWRHDLDTLLLMHAAAALAPDKADAAGKTPAEHLAEAYEQLGRKYPGQPQVQQACGDFFFQAGEAPRAFGFWLHSQELDPGNAELASTIGSAYLRDGNTRAAATQFQRAVDARPDQAEFHAELANVLYLFRRDLVNPPALPDPEAVLLLALEHFRLAAQLAPKDPRLAKAYAETFYALAKPDWAQALAAWQGVLALSGEDQDFANSHLARISLRMKRPHDAETYLDRLHRPEFIPLQAKLREQAKKLEIDPGVK